MTRVCVLGLFAAVLVLPPFATAGTITIKGAEPGTSASVSFVDGAGATEERTQIVQEDGTATFVWSQSSQDGARRIKKSFVKAGQAPATNTENAAFTTGLLPSLEPFDLPSLRQLHTAPFFFDIFLDIDLEHFLGNVGSLSVGQEIPVLDGLAIALPGYRFHIGDEDTGPLFTGDLQVVGFHTYRAVSEPASLTLLGAGLVLLLRRTVRRCRGPSGRSGSLGPTAPGR